MNNLNNSIPEIDVGKGEDEMEFGKPSESSFQPSEHEQAYTPRDQAETPAFKQNTIY